jgi:hypothetical protein
MRLRTPSLATPLPNSVHSSQCERQTVQSHKISDRNLGRWTVAGVGLPAALSFSHPLREWNSVELGGPLSAITEITGRVALGRPLPILYAFGKIRWVQSSTDKASC